MGDVPDDEEEDFELNVLTQDLFFDMYGVTTDDGFRVALQLAVDQLITEYEAKGGFMPTFRQALTIARDMHTLQKQSFPDNKPQELPVAQPLVDVPPTVALPTPPTSSVSPRSARRALLADAATKRLLQP